MRSVPRILRIACAAVALPVVVNGCSGGGTEPARVATTVVITPPTASFTAIGQTQQFAAVVKDQHGDTLGNAGVTWSSDNAAAVSVNSSGLATAVANGTAQITATSGTATQSVNVTVTQVAAQITKVSGDAQTGTVGQALAQPLVVQVDDSTAHAIAGITVNFTMAAGAGTLGSASATTGANGQAQTTWTLGQLAGTSHQVSVVPASGTAGSVSFAATANAATAAAMVAVSGNGQSGQVATALGNAIVVRVNDQFGNPVSGTTVTFAVTAGGGSVSPTSAASVATGQAQTTWTLGQTAGAQTMTASATGLTGSPVQFSAFAAAGPPASVAIQAGDNQTGTAGALVATAPTVIVMDAFNNPKPGAIVTFAVALGDGSLVKPVDTTDASGLASVGSWTLGAVGTNTMTATVTGSGITGNPATFSATATTSTGPAAVAVFVGDNQTGLVGYAVNVRPAVRVTDAGGGAVPNVSVTFAVASGGGSVTSATVNTNSNGVAQVGSWVLGGAAGANTLTATVASLTPVTFTATGANPQLNIVIRNIGAAFSPAVQTAFDSAEAFWERILYSDLSDVTVNTTDACQLGVTISEVVDDVLILASFDSIDGPGQTLAQAGWCSARGSNALPIYGIMSFDRADSTIFFQGGGFDAVILHEMGHVLGFSTASWNQPVPRTCAQLLSTGTPPSVVSNDTHFNCTHAGATNFTRAMFDSIGGLTYTGGQKVPLENCTGGVPSSCGPGNYNSHWRESKFGLELMTPYYTSGVVNPLSALTITSFQDIGYSVNYEAAQAYSQIFTAPPALAVAGGRVIDFGNDEYRGPRTLVDERTGRVLRVIQLR